MSNSLFPIAVVMIGKDEGERFRRSLNSLLKHSLELLVYVDSGSSDGSIEYAIEKGIEVIELDTTSIPFTHSRARNEGFERILRIRPDVKYVQFLDGDCEVFHDWFTIACEFLDKNNNFSSVCGKRLERNPEASIYNTQINMEWQGDFGEVLACGGDFLIRREDFESIGGFDPEFINGEDPELFIRLKKAGFRFYRLDVPMTEHDVNMEHFNQWWIRSYRCGHGYAHIFDVHGNLPQHYRRKQVISSIVYGALLPLILVFLNILMAFSDSKNWLFGILSIVFILLLYVRMYLSAMRYRLKQGNSLKESLIYGFFTTLAKPAHFLGTLTYLKKRIQGKGFEVIEYRK